MNVLRIESDIFRFHNYICDSNFILSHWTSSHLLFISGSPYFDRNKIPLSDILTWQLWTGNIGRSIFESYKILEITQITNQRVFIPEADLLVWNKLLREIVNTIDKGVDGGVQHCRQIEDILDQAGHLKLFKPLCVVFIRLTASADSLSMVSLEHCL